MADKDNVKYLGQDFRDPIDDLDTFPAPAGIGMVTMTSDEVTSFCPVTHQPDFYQVTIDYLPDQRCIESKSLKLYFWHFRERTLYCERLATEIRDKIVNVVAPQYVRVKVVQQVRGGIVVAATAENGTRPRD